MATSLLYALETDIKDFFDCIQKKSEDKNNKVSTIFTSERSFQLELAMHLKTTGNYDEVIMEYNISEKVWDRWTKVASFPWPKKSIYIDIVVRRGDEYAPIELKYVTAAYAPEGGSNFLGFDWDPEALGSVEILKGHSAQPIRCYEFWKDVKRIEFLKESCPRVVGGISLILSNDKSLWERPSVEASYHKFGLNSAISPREKDWSKPVALATGRPGFSNRQDYTITWRKVKLRYKAFAIYNHLGEEMPYVPKGPISDEEVPFRYCMVKINS